MNSIEVNGSTDSPSEPDIEAAIEKSDSSRGSYQTKDVSQEATNSMVDEGIDQTQDRRSKVINFGNSIQQKIRSSGSFIAKQLQPNSSGNLTTSTDDDDDIDTPPLANQKTNIPSSIVSAFSSLTSNFSLNASNNSSISAANRNSSFNGRPKSGSLSIETDSNITKLSLLSETREEIFVKKAALERKNLINLTKLIMKDLISSSLKVNRTYDDLKNAIHLSNFFTLIERVLKHGLKPSLLSHKSAALWNTLDGLQKHMKESTLIGESIRSLAYTKTPDGKVRAWMRLAMMQKKLPEYFSELLARKSELLNDIYHDYAFMLNDEAPVFAGLIIGVNVIDCNFFIKDANFDLMDDIIDLGPYLRIANSYDAEDPEPEVGGGNESDIGVNSDHQSIPERAIKSVLDQKNYLEEFNRRLQATISDLQYKLKCLEEENSKLEMEAKLSEAKIKRLEGKSEVNDHFESQFEKGSVASSITGAIKSFIAGSEANNNSNQENNNQKHPPSLADELQQAAEVLIETDTSSNSGSNKVQGQNSQEIESTCQSNIKTKKEEDYNKTLVDENKRLKDHISEIQGDLAALKERMGILETSYRSSLEKIKGLERDLDVQTSMNADKESTIKIYERDIKEKQSQVEHLRESLNDSKKLNSDLSERLDSTGSKLKERLKMVSNLQAGLDKWKLENKTLAARFQDTASELETYRKELEKNKNMIVDLKKYNEKINEELKNERQSGQSSSETLETQDAKILMLTTRLQQLESERESLKTFKENFVDLERKCKELELSLEEMGVQLRESRLESEDLRENSAVFLDSQWVDSKQVRNCSKCEQLFSVTRRKHHCRLCGNVFCSSCSDNKMELASSAKPVRVCDVCHSFLLAKFVKSASS